MTSASVPRMPKTLSLSVRGRSILDLTKSKSSIICGHSIRMWSILASPPYHQYSASLGYFLTLEIRARVTSILWIILKLTSWSLLILHFCRFCLKSFMHSSQGICSYSTKDHLVKVRIFCHCILRSFFTVRSRYTRKVLDDLTPPSWEPKIFCRAEHNKNRFSLYPVLGFHLYASIVQYSTNSWKISHLNIIQSHHTAIYLWVLFSSPDILLNVRFKIEAIDISKQANHPCIEKS